MYNIVNLIYCIFKENIAVKNRMNPQPLKSKVQKCTILKLFHISLNAL
jgi:hypothetical protein